MRHFLKRRRVLLTMAAIVVAVAAVSIGRTLWQAGRAFDDSQQAAAQSGRSALSVAAFQRTPPAGFEPVGGPAAFRDVAVFAGSLFLCGPGGVWRYDTEGRVLASYRAGLELPPAPAVSLAVARLGDAGAEELLIATAGEGVLAFNGREFRQLRPAAARLRQVSALLPLADGKLLWGTAQGGLWLYEGGELRVFHPQLKDAAVTALAGDAADLWVGTLQNGAWHVRGGRATKVHQGRVNAVVREDARAWLGTPLGMVAVSGDRVERTWAAGTFVQTMLLADGEMTVGTLEDGVFSLAVDARQPRPAGVRLRGGAPVERVFRHEGRTLVLTSEALQFNGRDVLRGASGPLRDRNIAALALDGLRTWIGYFDRGLDVLEGAAARPVEDDVVFCINRIVPDRERGRTLVATANGLASFNSAVQRERVWTQQDGLLASHVTDLLLEPGGGLTIATPAGITFLEHQRASSLYAFHGLVNNHVYALGRCGGRTLVGTLGGLSTLEQGLVKANFTTANSALPHHWISAIASTPQECFIGTYGGGVLALNEAGEWRRFSGLPPFEVNPNAMAVTPEAVYAGSLGRGLAVYSRREQRWRWVTEGLPSLNVTAVAGAAGQVWIGTDNGLVRVAEEALWR